MHQKEKIAVEIVARIASVNRPLNVLQIEVVWVEFVTWKSFFPWQLSKVKQTHSMEYVSQYKKNHEQEWESTCNEKN
jgi:hypothetical protein